MTPSAQAGPRGFPVGACAPPTGLPVLLLSPSSRMPPPIPKAQHRPLPRHGRAGKAWARARRPRGPMAPGRRRDPAAGADRMPPGRSAQSALARHRERRDQAARRQDRSPRSAAWRGRACLDRGTHRFRRMASFICVVEVVMQPAQSRMSGVRIIGRVERRSGRMIGKDISHQCVNLRECPVLRELRADAPRGGDLASGQVHRPDVLSARDASAASRW